MQVYEEIASHFSDTRHKPWPNVLAFVQALPLGSLVVDVGCGNGKYFGNKMGLFEVSLLDNVPVCMYMCVCVCACHFFKQWA